MVVVGFFFSINFLLAQNNSGIVEKISTALNSKTPAASLAINFDKTIEATILDKQANYSKTQAEAVLNAFFQQHSPTVYKIKHQGNSPDGSTFVIGNLITTNGNFNVICYAKQKNGVFLIEEIRFEKQ